MKSKLLRTYLHIYAPLESSNGRSVFLRIRLGGVLQKVRAYIGAHVHRKKSGAKQDPNHILLAIKGENLRRIGQYPGLRLKVVKSSTASF